VTPQEQITKVQQIMNGSPVNLPSNEKIDLVLDWFGDRPDINFDTTFVENLRESFFRTRQLTERQEAALDNIIDSWHIKM